MNICITHLQISNQPMTIARKKKKKGIKDGGMGIFGSIEKSKIRIIRFKDTLIDCWCVA